VQSRRRIPRAHALALAAITLLAVAALDQATKALAVASLEPGYEVKVFFGVDLNLVRNTGIAFGALAGAGEGLIVAFTAVAVGALLAFFLVRSDRSLLWLPVGMVLGGAAGNLIERARLGSVVDFIDPNFWPAFNLADAAIVLGVLGVLYVAEDARDQGRKAASGDGGRVGVGARVRARWRDSS
jgi:signal peptidase II